MTYWGMRGRVNVSGVGRYSGGVQGTGRPSGWAASHQTSPPDIPSRHVASPPLTGIHSLADHGTAQVTVGLEGRRLTHASLDY